jgi:uncharacterized membrane protein
MKLCLGKINFIVMGVAALLILVGFMLMGGAESTPEHFNPEVFSDRRVIVGPNVCFFGYLLMIVGIMLPSKHKKQAAPEESATPTV